MGRLHDMLSATDEVVTVKEVRSLLQLQRGRAIQPCTMNRLLKRHGWVRVPTAAFRELQSVMEYVKPLKRA